jgi:hypothetical protein
MTNFDSNTFEHDYVAACLVNMAADLKTGKNEAAVIDHYAVELTDFMNGQIFRAVKKCRPHYRTRSDYRAKAIQIMRSINGICL